MLSSIYTGQIKYIFQRWNCEFYSGDMSQNLQICTDYSLQRFLQWSSVCSPAIPVVFCREGQDPDNGETLVILHADVTIDKLLQGQMRSESLECSVKKMEDWFESKTYNEVAVVVTLSAVKTVAIINLAVS